MFLVDDMRTEQRWPDYAQHAAAHGVLSSLSMPLPFQDATIGALNTYAGCPKAFGEEDVVLAQEVAGWVALAVGSAQAAARSSEDLGHLRTAMMSRAFIDLAKGILMERHKVTEDAAFTMLATPPNEPTPSCATWLQSSSRLARCAVEADSLDLSQRSNSHSAGRSCKAVGGNHLIWPGVAVPCATPQARRAQKRMPAGPLKD